MDKVNALTDEQIAIEGIVDEPIEQSKFGVVVDCSRLNVRAKPRTEAEVVCIIDRGSKVIIDDEKSTLSFYKVCTEVGAEGYCMKQFINVLK